MDIPTMRKMLRICTLTVKLITTPIDIEVMERPYEMHSIVTDYLQYVHHCLPHHYNVNS